MGWNIKSGASVDKTCWYLRSGNQTKNNAPQKGFTSHGPSSPSSSVFVIANGSDKFLLALTSTGEVHIQLHTLWFTFQFLALTLSFSVSSISIPSTAKVTRLFPVCVSTTCVLSTCSWAIWIEFANDGFVAMDKKGDNACRAFVFHFISLLFLFSSSHHLAKPPRLNQK